MSNSFDNLGLSTKVTQAVEQAGYKTPTQIQAEAIPLVLKGQDLIGIAQTGTGKTASFVLPMLTLLEKGRARARMPRTLILEPTRELAAQVNDNFVKYGANHRLNVALLIGGVSFEDQNRILDRGADVLIATPGRLIDHFERGRLLLTGVEILIIDEADRMLDMGFIPDIERICGMLPPRRQTLFFSATMPVEIQRLTKKFLKNPIEIEVARQNSTAETITQHAVKTGAKPHERRATLRTLIDNAQDLQNGIIFCNRKRDVALVQRSLNRHGYDAGALHGDMDQESRTKTLAKFKDGDLKILVASDVAARGLDIPAVSHVFNFDIPTHAEDYVHRIGRTGRAGRSGTSYTIVAGADQKYLDAIEKLIGKSIDWFAPNDASENSEQSEVETKTPAPKDETAAPKPKRARGRKSESTGKQSTTSEQPAASAPKRAEASADNANNSSGATKKERNPFGDASQVPAFLRQSFAKA